MELLFTTYLIAKLERENGKIPFTQLLQQGTVAAFREFIKAGMQIEDDQLASREIDKFLSDGKTLTDLYIEIVKKLEDCHFLDRGASQVAMKQAQEQEMERQKVLSQTPGNEESQIG